MSSYPVQPATRVVRAPDRACYDRDTVHQIIDEALVAHVGFVADGRPVVLPMVHARIGERLYLHASTGARLAASMTGAEPICVTFTLVDGLVLARSAFHHSMNYRSVVVHGRAALVCDDAERSAAIAALVDAQSPGRSASVRMPNRRELAATALVGIGLEAVSAKIRTGPPIDEPMDADWPVWAGVLALTSAPGEWRPDGPQTAVLPALRASLASTGSNRDVSDG